MKKLGIDIGSYKLALAVLDESGMIVRKEEVVHHGQAKKCLENILKTLPDEDFLLASTGSGATFLKEYYINELSAICKGTERLYPEAESIIGIGSQSSIFISNFKSSFPLYRTNEHCAGGTGSFFLDQMSRLGLAIEDYSRLSMKGKTIPRLSGRCAVFAKTDIIHRQQEGVCIEDILLGLCYAMVKNYKSTIRRDLPIGNKVAFIGGVTRNLGVRKAILDVFELEEECLLVGEDSVYASAIGAALLSKKKATRQQLSEIFKGMYSKERNVLSRLPVGKENYHNDPECSMEISQEGAVLGIDIGSTSTNLVLLSKSGNLIDYLYLRTAGDPEGATRMGLSILRKKYGDYHVIAAGITGSGRDRIGKIIGADFIIDEITAQAASSAYIYPEVDTIFEIGGQDSKFTSLKNGLVVDFVMNKICAAGTGSFIEEQAARLGYDIEKFGEMAMGSNAPVDLGERCTVFISSAIATALAEGASHEDIASGLCFSIVRNYLNKVVNGKKIGDHIMLQGGVCYNPGIVAAFRSFFSNHDFVVNPFFSISGAHGVALLSLERIGSRASIFHGFESVVDSCRDGNNLQDIQEKTEFYKRSDNLLLKDYDGTIDPEKKTVGIPYVLLIHRFFPLANAFFKSLGFNVLLSGPSDEEIIRLSQESAMSETCYPVKLIYGHMKQLVDRNVDYIFLPTLHTLKHEKSKVPYNYGCLYMQSAPTSIAGALKIEKKGIKLLSPVFDLDMGKQSMATAMVGMGVSLGFSKLACLNAMAAGGMAVMKHTKAVEKQGSELLKSLKKDEKVLVLVTRNYGISDPVLNMGIPKLLLDRGYRVITISHLPGHDIDVSPMLPNICWPFGQHVLASAMLIKNHPNLYAVYLTNHGCGPDTMLSHLFADIMQDKPYLSIEVDEHFSKVGIITRIEAFLNALMHNEVSALKAGFDYTDIKFGKAFTNEHFSSGECVYLPPFGSATKYVASYIEDEYGLETKILPPFSIEDLRVGREETSSKEYITYTLLAGAFINQVKREDRGQFLLPSTLGSEADCAYPLVLSGMLKRKKCSAIVVSPVLESLYKNVRNIEKLFYLIVKGDEESLKISSKRRTIAVVGEIFSMTSMSEGVIDRLSERYNIVRAPLSEYLLFLWMENSLMSKDGFDFSSLLKILSSSKLTDYLTPFEKIRRVADEHLCNVNGGNIRYRFAKIIEACEFADAVIATGPRYENGQMVMDMRNISWLTKKPLLQLSFDGDWDREAEERLDSFLYYVDR